MPYILDALVIIVLGLCVFFAYQKGFVVAIFKLCSLLIALFLTNLLYPVVGVILRNFGLLGFLKGNVEKTLPLDGAAESLTHMAENSWIDALSLPEFIKTALIENNNTQARAAMAVESFRDYVSSYLAGVVLNAIAMLAVFLVVFLLLRIAIVLLKILTKLPVIRTLNKLLGVVLGLIQGTIFTWLLLAILVGLFATSTAFPVGTLLESSFIARWFHEHNIILNFITAITA